jgi:AP2-associated kinase
MYRPPEMSDIYQRFEVSTKVDIWMLGCVLYTMMFYVHPFQDASKLAIV